MNKLLLGLFLLLASCSQNSEPIAPVDNDGNNDPGNNGNPGSNPNNQTRPVAGFKVDRNDCVWPCKVIFTNQSTNDANYYPWWKFGTEGGGRDSDVPLYQAQRFLRDPQYIYLYANNFYPQLHLTYQKNGAGGTVTYRELNYRIRVMSPTGLQGNFFCSLVAKSTVTIATKFNNENTWIDLEITRSDNARFPTGRYKRGGSLDQNVRSNTPMAAYYLVGNPNKQILVYGEFYNGALQYSSNFTWKDESGELPFGRK